MRIFPIGSDTIELDTDGESITARCFVCHPSVTIGTWTEHVSLNTIIKALHDHQDKAAKSTNQGDS